METAAALLQTEFAMTSEQAPVSEQAQASEQTQASQQAQRSQQASMSSLTALLRLQLAGCSAAALDLQHMADELVALQPAELPCTCHHPTAPGLQCTVSCSAARCPLPGIAAEQMSPITHWSLHD